ncbi:MED6 mediator sub complex component-domain-containing protein [Apodospora peruviana]|uniref:Mediator of RNA polymerase II transcription subunit 6 n=1 Tax=Apodospora peruviana TaxID=516989 RepID=A0AAE0IIY2_9PEZI|nr:MED6 mediator sub complex component-domain-containing protein [Apodospora peruviana]
MATNTSSNDGPPLDEIQWRKPPEFEGGIHSNTILFYFAESPFFDHTSNNAVVFKQGFNNVNMARFLSTRELFEERLRGMSGLEFVVAQEPAETGPGAGTGVWVINKQTRWKRQGEEDQITLHATYFVVGENIYMAPTLADIISARIATISSCAASILPIADGVQTWSPSQGRVYQTSATTTTNPTSSTKQSAGASTESKILESLFIHEQFGNEFMDENPITGKPGEFHLSSTGRKDINKPPNLPLVKGAVVVKDTPAAPGLPVLNTKVGDAATANKQNGKETKSPRTPGLTKPKRRKSKMAVTPS